MNRMPEVVYQRTSWPSLQRTRISDDTLEQALMSQMPRQGSSRGEIFTVIMQEINRRPYR